VCIHTCTHTCTGVENVSLAITIRQVPISQRTALHHTAPHCTTLHHTALRQPSQSDRRKWVMSHMNGSCHTWTSHVTHWPVSDIAISHHSHCHYHCQTSLCHHYQKDMTLSSTSHMTISQRGGGLGSRPKKMYGEYLGDGVEYHLMSPTPRR